MPSFLVPFLVLVGVSLLLDLVLFFFWSWLQLATVQVGVMGGSGTKERMHVVCANCGIINGKSSMANPIFERLQKKITKATGRHHVQITHDAKRQLVSDSFLALFFVVASSWPAQQR